MPLAVTALQCLGHRFSLLAGQTKRDLLAIFIVCFGLSAGARGPIVTTQMAELFAGRGLASILELLALDMDAVPQSVLFWPG